MRCYLQYQTLADAGTFTRCRSIKLAKAKYRNVADNLARFEQSIEATIHVAKTREDISDEPDYYLSMGPKGGLVCRS